MILKEYLNLPDIALEYLGLSYDSVSMCEFGNQHITRNLSAKRYFNKKGLKAYCSFDLNGKDGARKINLNEPIKGYCGRFDIVTDFGTIEHLSNQYQAFKNMHTITRLGGYMIIATSLLDNWNKHSPYHYECCFFDTLSNLNKYSLKLNEVRYVDVKHENKEGTICVIMKKKFNEDFITQTAFNNILGLHYLEAPRRYSY